VTPGGQFVAGAVAGVVGGVYGSSAYHKKADSIRLKADQMYKADMNKAKSDEDKCKEGCSGDSVSGSGGGTEMSVTFDMQNLPEP